MNNKISFSVSVDASILQEAFRCARESREHSDERREKWKQEQGFPADKKSFSMAELMTMERTDIRDDVLYKFLTGLDMVSLMAIENLMYMGQDNDLSFYQGIAPAGRLNKWMKTESIPGASGWRNKSLEVEVLCSKLPCRLEYYKRGLELIGVV